jgi:hypothetical protein
MPYDINADEFFPDVDERAEINSRAEDALVPLIALRRLAFALGFDAVGEVAIEAERQLAIDEGVDLDDIGAVIEAAEDLVGKGLDAISELEVEVRYLADKQAAHFARAVTALVEKRAASPEEGQA